MWNKNLATYTHTFQHAAPEKKKKPEQSAWTRESFDHYVLLHREMCERWDLRESGGEEGEKFLTGNQNDRHHGVQTSSLNFPNNNNNPKKKYSERGGGGNWSFPILFLPFPRSAWDDSRRFTAFLLLLLAWNTRMKHDYSRYRTHTHTKTRVLQLRDRMSNIIYTKTHTGKPAVAVFNPPNHQNNQNVHLKNSFSRKKQKNK